MLVASRSSTACVIIILAIAVFFAGGVTHGSDLEQPSTESADTYWNGRARLVVEAGIQVHAVGSVIPTGAIAYDHMALKTLSVSLALSNHDRTEWDLNLTHLPELGLATVGAKARIEIGREVSALLDATKALPSGSLPQPVREGLGWGTSLEWRRVIDPIALSARLGWSGHSSSASGVPSASGSVTLLVNDYVWLSGSASIGKQDSGAISSTLGASLAYRLSALSTVYVKLGVSLAPAESVSVNLGFSRELQRKLSPSQ